MPMDIEFGGLLLEGNDIGGNDKGGGNDRFAAILDVIGSWVSGGTVSVFGNIYDAGIVANAWFEEIGNIVDVDWIGWIETICGRNELLDDVVESWLSGVADPAFCVVNSGCIVNGDCMVNGDGIGTVNDGKVKGQVDCWIDVVVDGMFICGICGIGIGGKFIWGIGGICGIAVDVGGLGAGDRGSSEFDDCLLIFSWNVYSVYSIYRVFICIRYNIVKIYVCYFGAP